MPYIIYHIPILHHGLLLLCKAAMRVHLTDTDYSKPLPEEAAQLMSWASSIGTLTWYIVVGIQHMGCGIWCMVYSTWYIRMLIWYMAVSINWGLYNKSSTTWGPYQGPELLETSM